MEASIFLYIYVEPINKERTWEVLIHKSLELRHFSRLITSVTPSLTHSAFLSLITMSNYKRIFFSFSTFFIIIVLLILTIFLVFTYKPTKPNFSVAKIEIKQLTLSGTILNSMIKIDLLSKNPNTYVRINYDEFHIYATYNNQMLTNESIVPPFNQGEGESHILSSSLIGNGLIVQPSISYELSRAQTYGSLRLTGADASNSYRGLKPPQKI
jgi:hypothetical protein